MTTNCTEWSVNRIKREYRAQYAEHMRMVADGADTEVLRDSAAILRHLKAAFIVQTEDQPK